MKAVLISIKPRWVEEITSGKKKIEVRKVKPKIYVPFKCYIYCTNGKGSLMSVNGKVQKLNTLELDLTVDNDIYDLNGKVIGEFVCDKIDVYPYDCHIGYPTPQYEGDDSFCDCGEGYWITYKEIEDSCLTQDELMDYGRGDTLYGWHISNLVIYEQPKDLREFKPYNRTEEDCKFSHLGFAIPKCEDCHECYVKKPPQSYLFVEELKGE